MINDDIHGLSGAYAVDAVDDVERARFEAHLAGCPGCQQEVQSLRAAASELSLATAAAPPDSLRGSVLNDIRSVRPLPPVVEVPATLTSLASKRTERTERTERARKARLTPSRWLAGVAAAAVIATGGVLWHPWSGGPGVSTVQLTAARQVLKAKDAQNFETKVGKTTARVVRSPSLNKAVIVTVDLPAAPEGKVYELWLQQGDTMVKAGFLKGGTSDPVVLQGDAATAAGAGITIEPAGGSVTPTLPAVALVNFA